MRERCRVTEELNAYMRLVDKADRLQAQIDTLADDIAAEVMGYAKGYDVSDWLDDLPIDDQREIFTEYLARKFARIEKGVTDDRQVQADEYLRERIKEWADDKAETSFEPD